MSRWDPQADDRLRKAAIALFIEHGYDNVTVTQIADRAGLTRRTFSRYFADKRDVLFAGSERLPVLLADALDRADPELSPFEAVVFALTEVAGLVDAQGADIAAQREKVIASSPELQERGRTKFAAVSEGLTEALVRRGTDANSAALLADIGVAILRNGFQRWIETPDGTDLATRLRAASSDVTGALTTDGQARPATRRSRPRRSGDQPRP